MLHYSQVMKLTRLFDLHSYLPLVATMSTYPHYWLLFINYLIQVFVLIVTPTILSQYWYRGVWSKGLQYFILLHGLSIYGMLLMRFQNIKTYIVLQYRRKISSNYFKASLDLIFKHKLWVGVKLTPLDSVRPFFVCPALVSVQPSPSAYLTLTSGWWN